MREILFRAKRINDGEWVEGYYAIARDRRGLEQHNILITDNKHGYFGWHEINPETVCQFTGLHDKNGNKIWENDIVEYHFDNTKKAPIRYGTYQSCFDTKETAHCGFYVDWSEKTYFRKDLGYWINMIEANVVGNIFDNPELLEGGVK